jgi:hypothetical protein
MDRWVGLGFIADNLINIGRVMEEAAQPQQLPGPTGFFKPAGHPRRALLCSALLTTAPKTSIPESS